MLYPLPSWGGNWHKQGQFPLPLKVIPADRNTISSYACGQSQVQNSAYTQAILLRISLSLIQDISALRSD